MRTQILFIFLFLGCLSKSKAQFSIEKGMVRDTDDVAIHVIDETPIRPYTPAFASTEILQSSSPLISFAQVLRYRFLPNRPFTTA